MSGKESIGEYLRKLRENKGGAISLKVLHHGASLKAIAAVGVSMIFDLMSKKNVDVITISAQYLPDLFGPNAFMPPKAGRPPKFKRGIVIKFKERGLSIKYTKGLIDFFKTEPKKS